MEMTKPGYVVVCVILICAIVNGGSERKRWKHEDFKMDHDGEKDELSLFDQVTQAEQVWGYCRKEVIERSYGIKEFDLHLLDETSGKRFKYLPPHMRQHFLDCLRKRNYPIPVSEEEGHLLKKLYESLFGLADGHKYLLSESLINQTPPSPDSESSPKLKSHVAAQTTSSPPTPEFSFHDFALPPKLFVPFLSPPPPPPPLLATFDQKEIVMAVVASGIVILIGFLLCCREVRKRKKVDKDVRPLLILTSSDMSGGSSQQSMSFENNDMKEYGINYGMNPSTVKTSSNKHEDNNASLAEIASSDNKGQVPVSPLKHPSGRSAPEASLPPPPPPPLAPCSPPPPPPLAPRPPPPPRMVRPPPAPPKLMEGQNLKSPLGPPRASDDDESGAPKPKLKPFFWDKVVASPDQAMVWHEIRAGSFQFSEEKIESLFGCANRNERKKDSSSLEPSVQYIQIIDPKKAQNLSILLRALNVSTKEVIDAIKEGNEIPVELIQTVLKMAPTTDEELKLRLFTDDVSRLSSAERFLKALVDIPLAFKRLESLLFMFTLPEEASNLRECFTILDVSCNKLRKSRVFQKLLEAVLKTGNRLNNGTYRGGAQAFKLDTLLKLADVKGTDGKTTLLHFMVHEIIRSEGIRAVRTEKASQSHASMKTEDFIDESKGESEEHYRNLGLQVVSGLSTELEDVKKAAVIDGDALASTVLKLYNRLVKSEELLNKDMKNLEEDSEFQRSLAIFVEKAREEVVWLIGEEKRIRTGIKSTADYFHGNSGKDEGLRLFVIVRDFLVMLDKVCKEVQASTTKTLAAKGSTSSKKEAPSSSPDSHKQSLSDMHRRLFPAIAERRMHDSSSSSSDDDDDDEMLPT
ncbi:unnamed protein product [Lathyrus sativus]|nr:unnamed protein product [Lathyrus sativus]